MTWCDRSCKSSCNFNFDRPYYWRPWGLDTGNNMKLLSGVLDLYYLLTNGPSSLLHNPTSLPIPYPPSWNQWTPHWARSSSPSLLVPCKSEQGSKFAGHCSLRLFLAAFTVLRCYRRELFLFFVSIGRYWPSSSFLYYRWISILLKFCAALIEEPRMYTSDSRFMKSFVRLIYYSSWRVDVFTFQVFLLFVLDTVHLIFSTIAIYTLVFYKNFLQ
jgi:hypothetical protein